MLSIARRANVPLMLEARVPVWAFYAFVAYLVAFMLVAGLLYIWRTARRKERPPEKFKLLRGPGETLRRRVQKADENLSLYVFGGAFAPLIIAWLVLLLAVRLPKQLVPAGALVAIITFIACLIISTTLLFAFLRRRRNDFIGYLGERSVAEHLEPLIARGYRIFHDVPAEGRDKNFNLDHVVIGPTGTAIVETKIRRKKKGREGYEEHVVTYDGQRLIWPWKDETWGLNQVRAEIDWLRKWIDQRTGIKTDVKAILAIPGWYVKERVLGSVRVANPKILPNIITQWNPQPLTHEQVDLISRQLDDRCRDVED